MSHAFEGKHPEDWEILDRRVVGRWGEGVLVWWLVLHPDYPQGLWAPFITEVDGVTVRDWPSWSPLPGSQMQFITSPIFETMYEGERGTGKSELLLMDFAKEVGKGFGANWRGILFRQELGDLDEMVRKTETVYKPVFPGFKFLQSKGDYAATWPSGERLLFRHLLDENEYKEYHGHQYPWIGFEELTQWPNLKAYLLMFSCCRPTAPGVPVRVRANTNPHGVGHNAVKKRFQLPQMRGRVIRIPGDEPRIAIRGRLSENFPLLHSDPNYGNRIVQAAASAAQAEAWSKGSWEVTEGGIVDDIWAPHYHVVPNIPAQRIPYGWRFSRSYDHGQSKPFAVLWWAESNGEPIHLPDGRWIGQVPGDLLLFAEWYGSNGQENTGLRMAARKIAQGIREREQDMGIARRVVGGAADANIWSKDSRGTGVAPVDDFESEKVFWDKADMSPGSRSRGWTLLREYLSGAVPNMDGTRDRKGIFICARNKYWLELVPPMPRSMQDPDDLPENYEDHCCDATRYRLTWKFMSASRRSF